MLRPKTFLLGFTTVDQDQLEAYLRYTDQVEFLAEFQETLATGVSPGEALCSVYAKICYKSLVLGKNKNVTKIRSIPDNFRNCMDVGHGSVLEHCWLNFITTDCSRVFTHELVRHRVGTAFSQTSGRYVTLDDDLQIVLPPELAEPYANDVEVQRCIDAQRANTIAAADLLRRKLIDEPGVKDFGRKKKITSAIRRLAPNGQTNEIGWSCNIRSVRHMLEMRTSRHAEWEIRWVFNEVADIIAARFPLMLHGAEIEEVDGLKEYCNLKV